MKHLNKLTLLLPLILLLTVSCRKDEVSPLEQLPKATQEGRGTFGCLVNGKAIIPKSQGLFGGSPKKCFYQFVDGGYYFHVSGSRDVDDRKFSVRINTDSLSIAEGMVIALGGNKERANGGYSTYTVPNPGVDYSTGANYKGELTITRLDEERRIVSGTFWFDAINKAGEKVEVREGRFDMLYN